ncbi:MAG: DUF2569 domain-containing protein [Rhizobiaceae bacterium]
MSATLTPGYRDGPSGVEGWLILPLVGLLLTVVTTIVQVKDTLVLLDALESLTGPFRTFLLVEVTLSVLIGVIAPVVLLLMLFGRKQRFPKLYIIWALATLVLTVADLISARMIFSEILVDAALDAFNADAVRRVASVLVLVGIWVPYMLNSRRVKNTFTT